LCSTLASRKSQSSPARRKVSAPPWYGLSRSQLSRGRDRTFDQSVQRWGNPHRARRHRRLEDRRARDLRRRGKFGRIDTLVNNAGIFIAKPFTRYTEADYQAVLGVNVAGFFRITQLAIAEMEKEGSGHVVQVSTGLVDHANSSAPSVLASLTKGGLNAATKSLAIEYAKRGIRVNAVALGIIKSPMHAVATHAQLDTLQPVGHMGEMSDVVDAVLYLEGDGFVTGEILHVDGGQSAGH
jgi:NAD(P)-dependent dehydrogenase (short-subunit alcohol dehydrogenase family)